MKGTFASWKIRKTQKDDSLSNGAYRVTFCKKKHLKFICVFSLNAEKLTCNLNNIIDFSRYSNYDEVWIRRFIDYLRKAKAQKSINESILKPNDLKEAEKLLKKANQLVFHLTDLSENNSKFCDLNVKIDEGRCLRCEGRLSFATISQKKRNHLFY